MAERSGGSGGKVISVRRTGGGGKMSKSGGTMITIDEVAYRVAELDPGYEFRYLGLNTPIDYRNIHVWRDREGDGNYYAPVRFGKVPVYLHEKGNPAPVKFIVDGEERVQHPGKFPLVKYKLLLNWLQELITRGEGGGDVAESVRADLEEAKTHLPPGDLEQLDLIATTSFPFLTTGFSYQPGRDGE